MLDKTSAADEKLQNEFNRWAEEGEGENMERHHLLLQRENVVLTATRLCHPLSG